MEALLSFVQMRDPNVKNVLNPQTYFYNKDKKKRSCSHYMPCITKQQNCSSVL